jgi:hypothetical protein
MGKSFRIKSTPGKDQNISIQIDQDFEEIELLSLKIRQSEVYPKSCANYGVIAGRVFVNGGYGLPKCKVSVFIPLQQEDENNPILTSYYPYRTLSDINEDGFKYNLLPYTPSYSGHTPTGTFPTREDVLRDPIASELYQKYYKYTVTTNESGDYMIYGVPPGQHTLVLNVDLSDIGEFSLTPQDLLRMGRGTESQFNGSRFKSSNNFNELPQIVYETKIVQVNAFWGQEDLCQVGITRADFDLSSGAANIKIEPTSVFMGSIFSTDVLRKVKRRCKVKSKMGQLCALTPGPGQILAIRQTIRQDELGYPILEVADLPQEGKVIDADGTWLIEVPMNLDYVYTNEFGEQVLSDDPNLGIPTKGKYRFKIKWQQPAGLKEESRRAYFLVPNIRERGWSNSNSDPANEGSESFEILLPAATGDEPAVSNISVPNGYVYQIESKSNFENLSITGPNDEIINGTNLSQNGTYTISYTTPNENQGSLVFKVISAQKFQLEASYAFSLSWSDYANPIDAIDCEDTFYQMQYNKVYTISQLLDRYQSRRFAWNTTIIKNINTIECENSINKFPSNDVQYRFDTIFIILSFFITIFKFAFTPILIVTHILAFLWPIIFVIMQIVYVIQLLIRGLCKQINKLRKLLKKEPKDCGEKPKRTKWEDNWFKNIKLPLFLYTSDGCERCDCKDTPMDVSGNEVVSETNNNLNSARSSNTNTSPLADFNSAESYNIDGVEEDFAFIYEGPISSTQFDATPATTYTDYTDTLFSNSLSTAERLNCFNLKDKYFNNTTVNGGVGRNQVKRTISGNGALFHHDNVMILVVDNGELGSFPVGQLISFSDPLLSGDVNLTGSSIQNTGGTNSITGTPITNGSTWSINYADPNNPSVNIGVNYTINYTGETPDYLVYPTDMEYFQVLTGLTLSSFTALTENHTNVVGGFLNRTNKPDFLNRYINNEMRMYMRTVNYLGDCQCTNAYWGSVGLAPSPLSNQPSNSNIRSPLQYLEGNSGLGILILQRGVDPHSPKVQQEIDLSRIFGWSNYNHPGLTITGEYKLNIPIQSNLKLPRHNQFQTNNSTDTFGTIFFNGTFNVQNTFSAYTSNLIRYYSRLGETTSFTPVTESGGYLTAVQTDSGAVNSTSPCCDSFYGLKIGWWFTNGDNTPYGYQTGEYIEGGSSCRLDISHSYGTFVDCNPDTVINQIGLAPTYTSNIYPSSTSVNMVNPSKLIMRTDRLPSSTQVTTGNTSGDGVRLLHQNSSFTIYLFEESGAAASLGSSPVVYSFSQVETEDIPDGYSGFVETLSECSKALPLECYVTNADGTVSLKPCDQSDGSCCGKNYNNGGYRKWFDYGVGCYNLVSFPIISIVKDFTLLTEFFQRLKLNLALCFDVFSHTFGNNWINGTLYMYPFQMTTFFDAQNKPFYNYCKDLVYFHDPTNTFYYRSSPYSSASGGKFIGRDQNERSNGSGNKKQLGQPTTILDLGPKVSYLQEIVFNDDYDGYIVDQLDATSFKDVTDILNILILSRLVNEKFISLLIPGAGGGSDPSISGFFNNDRWNPSGNLIPGVIDGDYSQMLSTNSEFGVSEFSPESYNMNTDVKLKRDSSDYAYFEIFFSADNQSRDYITPRRKIWNTNATISPNIGDFSYITTKSQIVPMYQWNVKYNSSSSIFGNQNNNWDTNESGYFKIRYQSLDRFSPTSEYQVVGSTLQKNWKGFIYNVDGNGLPTDAVPSGYNDTITFGTPFFFYFGVVKGSSAFDKFRTKYINDELI